MTEGHIAIAPSPKTLFAVLGGGFVVATAILVGVVLPAEYRIDPLGIGAATGLLKLSPPEEEVMTLPAAAGPASVANFYPAEYITHTVDIPLAAGGDENRGDDVEWKVRMKAGEALVYSWSVEAPPDEFFVDFHGETPPMPKVKVVSYRKAMGASSNGSFVAPFDGIHGWYLQNQSEKPVVVHLKLSGFFEIPPDPYHAATN